MDPVLVNSRKISVRKITVIATHRKDANPNASSTVRQIFLGENILPYLCEIFLKMT